MKALFIFTIGPVAAFIENGRKMRDLYAGSSIISELTSTAITYLSKQNELSIIFPPKYQREHKKNGETNVPNRLVVDICEYNEEKHKKMVEGLQAKLKEKFKSIWNESFKSLAGKNDLKIAEKQLDSFLEIYWLFQLYNTDEEYAIAYNKMISEITAIKGIRQFQQTTEPWGRKCLLHPEYNGIFVKEVKEKYPSNTNCEHIIKLPNTGKFQFDIKKNEALSAIAFIKRMYIGENSRFISPRDMVLENTITLKTGDSDLFNTVIRDNDIIADPDMKKFGINMTHLTDAIYDVWDGDIDYNPAEREYEYPKKVYEEAKELSNELKNEYSELKKIKLQQYYAIIKFDGDSMGIKYSSLGDRDAHSQLSEEICQFANCARKLIEDAGGICIYAGGEDVLAVLTLQSVWDTLEQLHMRFVKIGEQKIGKSDQTFEDAVKEAFTFSAGIVIAHLKNPLKDVMRRVSEAEKTAKKDEKNAFTISLMKRGSEIRTINYSFRNNCEQLQAFAELVDLFNEDQNSRSFVYNLSHLLLKLTKDSNREMTTSLIKQAIRHQRIGEEEKVMKNINTLYQTVDTESLMNTLDVIGFLSGKMIRPAKKEEQDNDV